MLLVCATDLADAQSKARSKAGTLDPPNLEMETLFTDDSGDRILENEEHGVLAVRLKNAGGEARDVSVRLSALKEVEGLAWDSTVSIASIATNETGEALFHLRAKEEIQAEHVAFRIEVEERSKRSSLKREVDVQLKETSGPNLVVEQCKVNEELQGSRGAVFFRNEDAFVEFLIRNTGERKARSVGINVVFDISGVEVKSPSSFSFEEIGVGEKRTMKVWVWMPPNISSDSLRISIRASERRPKFSSNSTLSYPIRGAMKRSARK